MDKFSPTATGATGVGRRSFLKATAALAAAGIASASRYAKAAAATYDVIVIGGGTTGIPAYSACMTAMTAKPISNRLRSTRNGGLGLGVEIGRADNDRPVISDQSGPVSFFQEKGVTVNVVADPPRDKPSGFHWATRRALAYIVQGQWEIGMTDGTTPRLRPRRFLLGRRSLACVRRTYPARRRSGMGLGNCHFCVKTLWSAVTRGWAPFKIGDFHMKIPKTALDVGATSKSIYYSIAQAGGAIVFHLPVLLLMPFMTNTLGIPAAAAGFAIFLPKIWIILCDPIVGSWSDRVQRRVGSRRGFVLWGGIATSLSLVALFIVPHIENALVMAGYMMLTYALVSTAYSMFAVPYLTMASEIAETPHERTLLSSWRMAFGFGGIMLTTLAPAAVEYFGGGRAGYSKMGLATGAICLALVLATSFAIRNFKIRRTAFAVESSLFLQMREAFRCGPFVVILRREPAWGIWTVG